MAGQGSRTLKLSILGDVDNLKKSLNTGADEVSSFGDKLGNFGKVAGAAFAAAGAAAAIYAGKLLADGVKAAIADEAAQVKLAGTLVNVTKASDKQIAAVESQITKTSLLTGLTDDELRPSFERLVIATGDADEALKLQALAIDVAAGSGKSLETVTNAMAKAAEGNTGALGKLGIGLSGAELKTMSMDEITAKLAENFGGQASKKAETFSGKMDRLKVAFDEGKETVGSFVLDAITPLVSGFVEKVIPTIQALAEELGPKLKPVFEALTGYIRDFVIPTFQAIWEFIQNFVIPTISKFLTPIIDGLRSAFEKVTGKIKDNEDQLKPLLTFFQNIAKFVRDTLAPILGKILGGAFEVLGKAIGIVIDVFATLVDLVNKAFDAIKKIVSFIKNNPVTQFIGGALETAFGGGRANGGPVSRGTSYLVGERGPEIFTPRSNGSIIPNGAMGGGTVINLNVSGAIDPEGTARTIINVLNDSFYRGTGGAGQLVTS
jgi:phage-related protein